MFARYNTNGGNAQNAHIWAQQTERGSKNKNDSLFFEGRTAYSYGYHFPLGVFINTDTVVLNTDSYSMSTSRHQSYVRQSVSHKRVLFADTKICKILSNGVHSNLKNSLNEYLQSELENAFFRLNRKGIQKRTKAVHVAEFEAVLLSTQEIASCYKIKIAKKFTNVLEKLNNDLSWAMTGFKKAEAAKKLAEKRAKIKRQEQYEIDAQEAIKHFIAGDRLTYEDNHVLSRSKKIYMRPLIDSKTMRTTQGAEFPIEHGIKAFQFIADCVENRAEWKANGHAIKLGNFHIDRIETNGNVTAGCHYVEFSEIERNARLLDLIQ